MSKCVLAEPVETTGSAWIICRSKTYINRVYYFNTLTGHAVWNLSEAEIEKARRAQKNFEKSTFSTEACPEPEGSPEHTLPNTMKSNNNRILRPKVYNKQVINNRFSRTSNYSPMNAMPMGIAVPTLYNPLIWNVPSQPVVLGHFNQPDYSTSSNINTQLPIFETSVPLSKRFSSYTETQNIQPTLYKNTRDMSQFTKRSSAGTSMNSVNRFKDNVDLRERLSARRSLKNFESHQNEVQETYEPPIYQNEETLLNMKDEDWLAKNLQKNPYSIDTSTIKQLVNVKDDTGFWYIVTDTTVLLSNTNFLRVLLNDDKQCNLILPHAVFEEIESISKSNLNPQAKQALVFISQQLILNQAFIDHETLNTDGLYIQDEILGCCSRISEQGYPVFLITNNVEMLHLKETVTYQILTMRELKKQACRPTESVKKYLPLNDIEPNIKITIPNELNEAPSKHQTKYIITDNESHCQPIIQSAVSLEDETNDIDLPVPCQQKDKTHDDDQNNTITTDEKDTPFSRKLKLIRQTSHDNSKNTSSNTKNFKWRRKSNTQDNLNELNKFENKNANENAHQHSSDINEANSDTKINNAEKVNITDSSIDTNDKADDDIIFIKTERLSPKYNASTSKDDKNVMFEITSENMEENLKLKCDEWVSRFIQIMEEVLTQVLHREPKYVCDAMPPPWTLYEATECTRKKFHSDIDIVDAANKLRNILFDIGGSRGKVKLNISPSQYMEMYSYGVYLTDALQSAISDCEDLQIAAESLYKLLSDIQDTNADINNQDSLCNITNEEIEKTVDEGLENITEKNYNEINNVKVYQLKETPNIVIRKKTQQNAKNTIERSPAKSKSSTISNELTSPSKYFLRSSRKSMPQKEHTAYGSKWDFLNKLDLTRTSSFEDLEPILNQETQGYYDKESSFGYQEPCQENQRLCDDNQACLDNQACEDNQERLADNQAPCQENRSEDNSFSNSEFIAQNSQKDDNTQNNNMADEKVVHPKIIRNFVRCIDFEEKLKRNADFTQDVDFSCEQNYDFRYGDGYYNAFNHDDYDYEYDDSQNDDNGYEFDDDYGYHEEEKEIFEDVNDMNCFINEVVKETKSVFTLVKNFCEKCHDLLNSSTAFDKSDTLQEAENASKNLDDICETLDSILKRETSASKGIIKTVSINQELNCIEMSDEEVNKYREVISKSLEQGKLLKEAIVVIINVIKSKT